MTPLLASLLTLATIGLAEPLSAQPLPFDTQGSWDISEKACLDPGISTTQIDIAADRIETYGGDALVRDIDRSGPVTFVAADFLQREGVEELGERERVHFRLTQREGPDRLNLIWKDVDTVDLVRCTGGSTFSGRAPAMVQGPLPIPTGLWVIAGEDCASPANAAWRVYDGLGLYGASSRMCRIGAAAEQGGRHVIDQTCVASYDGGSETHRDTVIIQAPRRFSLIEDGETEAQDFNWCGSRLYP